MMSGLRGRTTIGIAAVWAGTMPVLTSGSTKRQRSSRSDAPTSTAIGALPRFRTSA
jgi:hypothetical protein